MTSPFTVRRAGVDDAEAFIRAHEEAWDAGLSAIVGKRLAELAPFEARVENYRASMRRSGPNAGAWLAERGREVVGIAVRVDDELRDLYVVPAAWGSGVARMLMEAALDAMEGDEAVLWVGAANARARRFYERERWEADGESRTSAVGPLEVRYRRRVRP